MKKVDDDSDELRPEYRREDFGQMVRGSMQSVCANPPV
jgi:hypothetical protein